jgi:hypothetical protein
MTVFWRPRSCSDRYRCPLALALRFWFGQLLGQRRGEPVLNKRLHDAIEDVISGNDYGWIRRKFCFHFMSGTSWVMLPVTPQLSDRESSGSSSREELSALTALVTSVRITIYFSRDIEANNPTTGISP